MNTNTPMKTNLNHWLQDLLKYHGHLSKVSAKALAAIVVTLSLNSGTSWATLQLAAWDFSTLPGGTGNFGPSPDAATTTDSSVSAGSANLTRGSGLTTSGTGAAGAWGANGFSSSSTSESAAILANDYVTISLTVASGYSVSLSDIAAYNIRRSSTGPTTGIWQYSINGGAYTDIGNAITWGTSGGNSQSAITLSSISDLQNLTAGTQVSFRVDSWGATSSSGTWYFNDLGNSTTSDLIFDGTVTPVPEPVNVALGILGASAGLVAVVRFVWRKKASPAKTKR